MTLKHILRAASLSLPAIYLFVSGCSALRPAAGDPVKKDGGIEKVRTVKAEPESVTERVIVTKEVRATPSDRLSYSVSDLNVEEKNNGVMISLNYKGDDPKSNITTFFSGDNFFNISLYKGRFSEKVKNYVYSRSVITSVKFFEFEDSVQITFRLRKDYTSSVVSTSGGKIIISVFN